MPEPEKPKKKICCACPDTKVSERLMSCNITVSAICVISGGSMLLCCFPSLWCSCSCLQTDCSVPNCLSSAMQRLRDECIATNGEQQHNCSCSDCNRVEQRVCRSRGFALCSYLGRSQAHCMLHFWNVVRLVVGFHEGLNIAGLHCPFAAPACVQSLSLQRFSDCCRLFISLSWVQYQSCCMFCNASV